MTRLLVTVTIFLAACASSPPANDNFRQVMQRQVGKSADDSDFYPTLYRLERRGLIQGRWVERAGVRRRRFYRLTAQGQQTLDAQRV